MTKQWWLDCEVLLIFFLQEQKKWHGNWQGNYDALRIEVVQDNVDKPHQRILKSVEGKDWAEQQYLQRFILLCEEEEEYGGKTASK